MDWIAQHLEASAQAEAERQQLRQHILTNFGPQQAEIERIWAVDLARAAELRLICKGLGEALDGFDILAPLLGAYLWYDVGISLIGLRGTVWKEALRIVQNLPVCLICDTRPLYAGKCDCYR